MREGIWLPRGFVATAAVESLLPNGEPGPDPTGGYVAWLVSQGTATALHDWCKLVGIPTPVPPDAMHATVMYSPEHTVDECYHGDEPLFRRHVEDNPGRSVKMLGDNAALVVTLGRAPVLAARHSFWEGMGLVHSYPSYLPHVTLSYAGDEVPADVFDRIRANPPQLPITFDRERVAYCKP